VVEVVEGDVFSTPTPYFTLRPKLMLDASGK
jgi:hypothetical protein